MSSNTNDDTAVSCRLHRFEKNRYFHGKLMTARDMETEQQYHVGRQKTLTRHVAGEGLLCGLPVTVEEGDDTVDISVGQGLAIDCCGNPIVVKNAAEQELSPPQGNEIYVHLSFRECSKESVPIPGSENACEQECAYNRVLEIFEITYEETPPAFKTVPDTIEYPTPDDLDDDEDGALALMARSYYDGTLTECETCDDPSVFVGAFTRSDDGWVETPTDRRPFVYTNDMLYAAIARHVADFENPHQVSATQTGALVNVNDVTNPGSGVDLVSRDDTVAITPDDDENAIELQTSAAAIGALVSVNDVSNPGDNVDLVSAGGISIDADDFANEIRLEASAESVGALTSVDGVTNPGGDVDLDSSDGTIDVDPDDDANEIDLRVSDAIQDRFDEFEDRLDTLRTEFDAEVETLSGRLKPLERYVMDKTLKFKRDAFTGVTEEFRVGLARRIVEETNQAIENEVFRDEDQYVEFLETAAELEQQLPDELDDLVTEESLDRYASAVDGLIDVLGDDTRVVEAAVEQDYVCETAQRLERIQYDLTVIDGIGEGRREQLHASNITTLRDLIDAEPEEIVEILPRVDIEEVEEWIAEAKEILRV